VDTTELRNRIITVFDENFLVQTLCVRKPGSRVNTLITGEIKIIYEFIEKKTSETFGASTVTSEQRALDYLWKVDQCKNRTIQIGEITNQNLGFGISENFGDVNGHDG
jgi:citrate lyase alpha subunit